jgi:hypothetical protein
MVAPIPLRPDFEAPLLRKLARGSRNSDVRTTRTEIGRPILTQTPSGGGHAPTPDRSTATGWRKRD